MSEKRVRLDDVEADPGVQAYLEKADHFMDAVGYTEHGLRHGSLVAETAAKVLSELSFPGREAELAAIAGYLHDIGNVISREDHGVSGGIIAYTFLERLGMPPEEIAVVVNAIGNHDEDYGYAASNVSAALMLGDKSDVHRDRVVNPDPATFDIHDRVNYAAERSELRVDAKSQEILLEISIDTHISRVMEYFEIFLSRMVMCRRAAEYLDCRFGLVINSQRLL